LAVIVLVPMILGLAAYAAGTSMGAAQHRAANAPPAAAAEVKEREATAEKKPEARPRQGRGGPPGPPQSERQAAVAAGLGMALPIWWLASVGVMIWTLLWVARLPNDGQGRIRTGSHLTPEEIADGV
jgi:Flp pilus assembly protein TadB